MSISLKLNHDLSIHHPVGSECGGFGSWRLHLLSAMSISLNEYYVKIKKKNSIFIFANESFFFSLKHQILINLKIPSNTISQEYTIIFLFLHI